MTGILFFVLFCEKKIKNRSSNFFDGAGMLGLMRSGRHVGTIVACRGILGDCRREVARLRGANDLVFVCE